VLRAIAAGEPARLVDIARRTGLSAPAVRNRLARVPALWTQDSEGGYWLTTAGHRRLRAAA
jgi:hypothetical protein